ncbi:MAG: glycosyltransferase family 1 protein [Candidatus Saccharimonadales bacterium]
MKRIAIDARIINSSTGRYVERLLTYLQDIDRENHYIVLVPTKDVDYWKPKNDNFEVQTVDYKNYSFGEQIGFCTFLYDLRVDLVHFCMPQQPLFYLKPHVTTIHDMTLLKTYNSDKNWAVYHVKQFVGRILFYVIGHTSKQIIAISEFTKTEYVKHANIDPEKVSLTYESADVLSEKPKKPDMVSADEKYILYVGQQSDYKNIRRLMEAHQALRVNRPDLKLMLVGSLNEAARRNKYWAEQKGLQNIVFTGFVSDDELAWLYNHTRAYVFPSLMEGFGLPGLEAMVHNAPVASSNATCLPEVYGDAALYFDPTSVQDMTKTIASIIDDESVRKDLIAKGVQKAGEYSWKRMAQQTRAVYNLVLGE